MDVNLRREIILDNYNNPKHRGLKEDESYITFNSNNESCIDDLNIAYKISDNLIEDVRFDGEACAISTSAVSIMIKSITGKTKEEALNILNNFENMINELEYDKEVLGELNVYEEIYKQPNRKNCALLPFVSLRKIIEEM